MTIRSLTGNDIVQFIDNARGWSLKVRREVLKNPLPLSASPDAQGQGPFGMLERAVQRIKTLPEVQILRQDVVRVGNDATALLAASMARTRVGSCFSKPLSKAITVFIT